MPAISSSAPGKIILFGEHAVVYGRPAIAIPVMDISARAVVLASPLGKPGQVEIKAPMIGLNESLATLDPKHPFAVLLHELANYLHLKQYPAFTLKITSSIPVSSGLGSGAAVSTAIVRAVSSFLGQRLDDATISSLVFITEKIFHGTPSGIDNTVVAYARPLLFTRGEPNQFLRICRPFNLIIADTGVRSPTIHAVSDVRKLYEEDPQKSERIFDQIAAIVKKAHAILENGPIHDLGPLMTQNHDRLKELTVSSKELDALVDAAMQSGALGAKLSGAGRGGNMIALVRSEDVDQVTQALTKAGAVRCLLNQVRQSP
jgi:mevalonate kinase